MVLILTPPLVHLAQLLEALELRECTPEEAGTNERDIPRDFLFFFFGAGTGRSQKALCVCVSFEAASFWRLERKATRIPAILRGLSRKGRARVPSKGGFKHLLVRAGCAFWGDQRLASQFLDAPGGLGAWIEGLSCLREMQGMRSGMTRKKKPTGGFRKRNPWVDSTFQSLSTCEGWRNCVQ